MVVMIFNMCNQNNFNREQCMKDWDVWLHPEIQRFWQLYTNVETPYSEESRVLESKKED